MDHRGYQRLAVAVIAAAVQDAEAPLPKIRPGDLLISDRRRDLRRRLRAQIDAAEFLLLRDDPLTRLWFQLAGLVHSDVRRSPAALHWRRRLALLRPRLASIVAPDPRASLAA